MSNLYEEDSRTPLPQASVDNLVQIGPKHLTHDIIPTNAEEISFSKYNKTNLALRCKI